MKKIIINNKEFTAPKVTTKAYKDYLDLCEQIDTRSRYTRADMDAMAAYICAFYGGEFTQEELEECFGPDEIIAEFAAVDMEVSAGVARKLDAVTSSFR